MCFRFLARWPRGRRPGSPPPGRRALVRLPLVAVALLAALPMAAQNIVSVPFTNGFVGTRGSSAGTANNVLTFATLGIARLFFVQNSSTPQFEQNQGNDIAGTLRIVRSDGTIVEMPAAANWRNSGGSTYLIGILPRPTSPVTLTYGGGSIQITDGGTAGGSSIGGYVAGYQGATLTDGQSTNGNAATSQVLAGLNAYLATVVAQRPAGPVTVTAQATSSTTPTIAGTATLGAGEQLSVIVAGAQYTTGTSPAIVRTGSTWSLALGASLAVGTYEVTATITDADGFTLSDGTTNELVVTPVGGGGVVTIGGSFTAAAKSYDGTTTATGITTGLSLVGVQGGHSVSIAGVTLAFQSPRAGPRTVVVTGVTLGGPDATLYTVDLTGAPTAAATIAQAPLTVTGVTATGRTYDGTTAIALAGTAAYAGLVGGESFAVSGTPSASVATPDVGTAKPVTVTGYLAPSADYALSQPAGLVATVSARAATIGGSFTVADRPADGTTGAAIATNALVAQGAVAGDTLGLAGIVAAFADPAPGTGKPVTITAATLTGTRAANYALSLAGAPAATASLTAPVVPTAPIGTGVVAGEGALTVSWSPPSQLTCGVVSGWVVDWSADGGATWTRGATPAAAARGVVLQPLVNNRPYLVRVAAVNGCGTGAFASAGPATPLAPTRDGQGQPRVVATGDAAVTGGGTTTAVVPQVTGDTLLALPLGPASLRLRAVDDSGSALPVDSTRVVALEQGGAAGADGSGFAVASTVTLWLVSPTGSATLLGSATVDGDGRFATSAPIAASTPTGAWTLQVVGVDAAGTERAAALGVTIAAPPPELDFAATPDRESVAVGDTVAITLVVTNRGTGPALDVRIPRAFDEPGFAVVRAVPAQGSYDATTRTWRIARIDPGATARLVLTATVVAPPTPAPAP